MNTHFLLLFCVFINYARIMLCQASTSLPKQQYGATANLLEIMTTKASRRNFQTQHQKLSLNDLTNLKDVMTLSERAISFAVVALQEYTNSQLFSGTEQLMNNEKKQNMIFNSYGQIRSSLKSITCSMDDSLQTIMRSVRLRGFLNGQDTEAEEVSRKFQTVQLQLKYLQITSTWNGGDNQCPPLSSLPPSYQQYLNFNIAKETNRIIGTLKDFVKSVNYTFNDCSTVDTLITFLSRGKNLLPANRHVAVPPSESPQIFNQSIRYKWNETERRLCDVLHDIQAQQSLTKINHAETDNIQVLMDVTSYIKNSLSALGSNDGCSRNTLHSTLLLRMKNIQSYSQNMNGQLNQLLLDLNSYKNSKFCSHL